MVNRNRKFHTYSNSNSRYQLKMEVVIRRTSSHLNSIEKRDSSVRFPHTKGLLHLEQGHEIVTELPEVCM